MKVLIPNFWLRAGLVLVVAQDYSTHQILMVAFTREPQYLETLRTGHAVYFSRSRWKRWEKGEESGDFQIVRNVLISCNGAAIIFQVDQMGEGACHTKARSCFYRDCFGNFIMPAPKMGWKENLLTAETAVAPSFMLGKTAKTLMPNFSKNFGLVDVVVQDFTTGQVIEVNATDRAGYFKTLETGMASYVYSVQHERWTKEMSDNNIQVVRQILIDCDGDALLYNVDCKNADVCHNGSKSSFYRNFFGQQILPVPLCAENYFSIEIDVIDMLASKAM